MHTHTFVHIVLATATASPGLARAQPFPQINIQGDTYASACSAPPWQAVTLEIHKAAAGRHPELLTAVIKNFLCGTGEAATLALHQSMPSSIEVISEETGTPGKRTSKRPRSEFSPLAGRAWQVSVQRTGAEVGLSYLPNEACAAVVRFRYSANAWRMVGFGEACD